MDGAIAYMAKNCAFDAAHYTWVFIDGGKLGLINANTLETKLLEHGDYATPLRTREVKQPFDNMAVVVRFRDETYALFTFDCRDSMLYEVNMWGGIDGELVAQKELTKVKILTLHFRPRPEQFKGVPPASEEHNPKGKSQDALVLVSMLPQLPQNVKDSLVENIIPLLKKLSLYIPCASEGLLTGNDLEYYRPKALGNNAKRIRKGKSPLFEWRTVTLERKRHGLPSAPKGGTHASPRLHQRRGHWSVSKLGKKYWRRETVVGNPDNGMLFHDYTNKENPDARH
jgi:hypothetical protein